MIRDTPPSQDASTHKFGTPSSKNIGDMHRTEAGRTDGQCDYYMPPLGAYKYINSVAEMVSYTPQFKHKIYQNALKLHSL